MGKRMTKAERSAISLMVVVAAPFVAIFALYQAIGPYAFFGLIAAAIILYIAWNAHQRRTRLAADDSQAEARRQEQLAKKARLLEKYGDVAIVERIMSGTVWQGQSADQVRDSIGSPVDVDERVMKTKRREVWKYHHQGGNRYGLRITLEHDLVVGWEEKL